MPIFIPNPSSTIHDSCQAYITFYYIHVSHHNIHTQTNTNHPRINKHPNNVLPRPVPRSGETCSLRRGLERASRTGGKGLTELRHGTWEHSSSCDGLVELAEQRNSRKNRISSNSKRWNTKNNFRK